MQQNPGMVEQMSSMMSNPIMRAQMEPSSRAMMTQQQQQPTPSFGGATGNNATNSGVSGLDMNVMQHAMAGLARLSQQQQPQQQQQQSGTTDTSRGVNSSGSTADEEREMTEEEMIQEAIRRSLQD